ncbi:saccharopine dehydrogenase [Baekduia soli]|uniref:Saccharopine dehydrogenase n=1 Tax=Baekduia soli TaxID=496014 RepID=A0A5B8U4C6_9ACTN|nr:saccharopine dehydrogenase NADP-binding domain-containing protein [Baekduia soli]QEC47735.1 saccharopine dehydrogenase [Baekduia soli]
MAGRIVLLGATGYTGELTARELAGRGERPVLAGRDADRVRALADGLGGLDWAVADVGGPQGTAAVRALLEAGDVLVSTVGPFTRLGAPAVEAAIDAGAHYLDSTGEAPFIRRVFASWGPRAAAAGSVLLTAMGYDWVPGNLAGALALREAGEGAVQVQIGYFTTGGAMGPSAMSGGTRASAAGVLLGPSFAFRGGRLVGERGGARARSFGVKGKARRAISAGSTEHFALPRSYPGLRDVDVFLGWFGGASDAVRAVSAATALLTRVPGVREVLGTALGRVVTGSSGGPGPEARALSGSYVVAEARDAGHRLLATAVLEGVNGYDFTAGMLAWGAHAVAAGRARGAGALGPVEAFGLDALSVGVQAAGLRRIA